jgi:hypothetical protein
MLEEDAGMEEARGLGGAGIAGAERGVAAGAMGRLAEEGP